MKKPEPEDMAWGGGAGSSFWPSPWPWLGLRGTMLNGKFSKPGICCSERRLTRDLTSMETTAGETRSKMSANDIGAPGGGAKMGAVEALIRLDCSALAGGHCMPEPARAAAATPAPAIAPTR
jgi:hypothetical protein